jgi:hypothetical protein
MLRVVAAALALVILAGCRSASPPTPTAGALRLLVEVDGIYRLTEQALRDAGLQFDRLTVDSLHLSREGQSVPFLLLADSLVFYGQSPRSRYTASQAYVLRSGEAGIPMAEEPVPPAGPPLDAVLRTIHVEENWEYIADALYDGEEPWFWQTVPLQGTVELSLPVHHPSSGGGELHLRLYGASHNPAVSPDHSLAVHVNAHSQPPIRWDGQTAHMTTLTMAAGTLQDGDNRVLLENLPEDFLDIMKLDWMQLDYEALPIAVEDRLQFSGASGQVRLAGFSAAPLLLDVSDPDQPARLVGWEPESDGARLGLHEQAHVVAAGPRGFLEVASVAPLREAGWRSAEHQADMVVVTTDELVPELAPLVAAREEQGFSVAVVPIAEIYDEFGHGMETPDSINAFIAYTQTGWAEPRPGYLLLVGDATTDFRGYLASRPDHPVRPPRNVIPPYLVPVSYSGETVSDARLADVNGDMRPDLAVGRWPVDDPAGARALVARTLAYEAGSAPARALFASDGSSEEFTGLTERVLLGSTFPEATAERLSGPTNEELVAAWNEGAWLITYAGHGSLQLWGKDNIFSAEAVPALAGAAIPPIVLQLTCLTGLFAHPEITSLSERLLAQEGGPVLTIAATSLTLSSLQEPFAIALLQALQDPAVRRIGDALQLAKQSLDVTNDGLREISDTFGLLGDPSALIVRP